MKKELDWKDLGRFNSMVLNLFVVIRDVFTEMKIGIEIVGWLLDEGKDVFVEKFLRPLGNEFLATHYIRVISETVIMVNLDVLSSQPGPLSEGAKFDIQTRYKGWAKVEKRGEELYVNGSKVILYLSEFQKFGNDIWGYKLQLELLGKSALHPNILNALIEHPNLIPENWKKDEMGHVRFIFFWAVIFREFVDGKVCPYVMDLHWNGNGWSRHGRRLECGWSDNCQAALLES